MMKCVFVLVLLHFCVSAKSDTNLNMEIINRLNKLCELYGNFNFTPTDTVKIPAGRTTGKTKQQLLKCVGVIRKELRNLLNIVMVPEADKHYVQELRKNLNALGEHTENDTGCPMKAQAASKKTTLKAYINFFRILNTRG